MIIDHGLAILEALNFTDQEGLSKIWICSDSAVFNNAIPSDEAEGC